MLRAARKFSLGERTLEPGDEITWDEQKRLPVGRVQTLLSQRYVTETPTFEPDEEIARLSAEVDQLKAAVAKLEKRQTAARKRRNRKVEAV